MIGKATYSQLGKMGRLGNQLFQISSVVAYGLDTNRSALFPEWEYKKYMRPQHSKLGLSVNCGELPEPDNKYNEPAFTYSPIPKLNGNVDLLGYFQSYKYFDKWRSTILDLFSINSETSVRVDNWFRRNVIFYHKNYNYTCSIHVRRGDYISNPQTNAYHGVLDMDYYYRAVTELPAPVDEILFVVVSDDIEWCKQHFKGGGWPNVVFSEGNDEITDLFIQVCCDWNIIANSSFSWWGHYLNRHKGKICVAPKNWFANAELDTRDLYLPKTIIV